MDNLQYFKFSQNNKDDIIDFSDPQGILVISETKEAKLTPLMRAVKELNNLIITYETLSSLNEDKSKLTVLDKIIDIIENTDLINYSPFCVYFQVLGYSFSSYKSTCKSMTVADKRNIIGRIVDAFIKNRHHMYLEHGNSYQSLQVMADAASSRRKGMTGIIKLENILSPLGFHKANDYFDFCKSGFCYVLPDRGQKFLFDQVLRANKISFDFKAQRQNKYPDMLIKMNNQIMIVEHKLTNGGGGSQNAEINEIISFIQEKEKNKNVHYVSCLDGDFINNLKSKTTSPKCKKQYEQIIDALKNYPRNYFVNGNGLKELIANYLKEL